MTVIDLFAGPGGWDVAARRLGMDPIGLEWDDAACATRRAAGLRTMQCDVGAVDLEGATTGWKGMGVTGLIASPPCQAFSMAGLGAGRAAIDAYLEAVGIMRRDGRVPREWLDERCHDERAHLVLEPLRWAQALRPEWVCLEQVKEVLPIWEAMAPALEDIGFSTWTGLLSSERFGVPPPLRYNSRSQSDSRTGEAIPARQRSVDEPAPTIAGQSRNDTWVHERPATTVACDPRIAEPGHKKDDAFPDSPGRMTNSVRVTIEEALILQSFPGDYPVQGTNTKQFEQVGNAIPPGMAEAILEVVT